MIKHNVKNYDETDPLNGGESFSLENRITRVIWTIIWFVFARWTPPKLAFWRRFLLRLFGAKMGKHSDVRASAKVWLPSNLVMENNTILGPNVNCYNQALVNIMSNTIVSQGVQICCGTHDYENDNFQLIAKPIHIGKYVWICAESFIGPGTIINDGCVIGAKSLTYGNIEAWTVYAGVPAKKIKNRNWRPK